MKKVLLFLLLFNISNIIYGKPIYYQYMDYHPECDFFPIFYKKLSMDEIKFYPFYYEVVKDKKGKILSYKAYQYEGSEFYKNEVDNHKLMEECIFSYENDYLISKTINGNKILLEKKSDGLYKISQTNCNIFLIYDDKQLKNVICTYEDSYFIIVNYIFSKNKITIQRFEYKGSNEIKQKELLYGLKHGEIVTIQESDNTKSNTIIYTE